MEIKRVSREQQTASTWPLFFARPRFCHGLVGNKIEIGVFRLRMCLDIVDDDLHALQVGRFFRWTKPRRLGIQRVEDFDGPRTTAAVETVLSRQIILAARQEKIGAGGMGDGLALGLRLDCD